jgi:hypothetical protein
MKAKVSALLLAILLAALVFAASVQVTISFVNAPASIEGAKLYIYDSTGKLVATAAVSGASASATLDNSYAYLAKLDAQKLYAIFTIPVGATSATFNFAQAANVTVKVNVAGGFLYKPSGPIEYTVALSVGGTMANATVSTAKALYAQPGVKITLPETLLFPSVYGFKLANITLNGAPVQNGFTISSAGSYTVEANYEFSGMPWWVFAGVAALLVLLIAAAAARGGRKARMAMALAQASEWLED